MVEKEEKMYRKFMQSVLNYMLKALCAGSSVHRASMRCEDLFNLPFWRARREEK